MNQKDHKLIVLALQNLAQCGHPGVVAEAENLLRRFQIDEAKESKPLTFGELLKGDYYIAFPQDGDDSGHGGHRRGSYLYRKTSETSAVRLFDHGHVSERPSPIVLKVLQ